MDEAGASSIAVLKTRLPYIDRRALSQAWFSALTLADARSGPATARARIEQTVEPNAPATGPRSASGGRSDAGSSQPAMRTHARRSDGVPENVDRHVRRQTVYAASKRRHRAADPPHPRRPGASFVLTTEHGRIALLIRRRCNGLDVVALCTPANVDVVRRALACAHSQLRFRGETIRTGFAERLAPA